MHFNNIFVVSWTGSEIRYNEILQVRKVVEALNQS